MPKIKLNEQEGQVTATVNNRECLPNETKSIEQTTYLRNFTMTPNWFDKVFIEEKPCVAPVLWCILRATIGHYDKVEGRRQEIKVSYATMAHRTGLSQRSVGEAIRISLERGYLLLIQPGRIRTSTAPGEAATYAINWNWNSETATSRIESNKTRQDETSPENNSPTTFPTPCHLQIKNEVEVTNEQPAKIRPNLERDKFYVVEHAKTCSVEAEITQQILPTYLKNNDFKKTRLEIDTQSSSTTQLEISSVYGDDEENPANQNKLLNTSKHAKSNSEPNFHKPNSRKGSSKIGQVITDFTSQLGDRHQNRLPNISRSLNLWQQSGLDEKQFIGLLYQARQCAMAAANIRKRQTEDEEAESKFHVLHKPSQADFRGNTNRMPYFFAVLEDLIANPFNKDKAISTVVCFESKQANESTTDIVSDNTASVSAVKHFVEASENSLIQQITKVIPSRALFLERATLQSLTTNTVTLEFAQSWHSMQFRPCDWERLESVVFAMTGKTLLHP